MINKMRKKREAKKVVFNEDMNEVVDLSERKWDDYKGRNCIQGQFTVAETKALIESLCSYGKMKQWTEEELLDICSKPSKELSKEHKKSWCKISESLPNRSVKSIHNFCRRRFNPENYSGKWTKEEEESLLSLVSQLGPQWKSIARVLND